MLDLEGVVAELPLEQTGEDLRHGLPHHGAGVDDARVLGLVEAEADVEAHLRATMEPFSGEDCQVKESCTSSSEVFASEEYR